MAKSYGSEDKCYRDWEYKTENIRPRIFEKDLMEEMGKGRNHEGRSLKKKRTFQIERQGGMDTINFFVGCRGKLVWENMWEIDIDLWYWVNS